MIRMIKKIFILIIFLLVLTGVYSQNLVPNGSFENYLRIPLKPSQLNLAPPWQQLSNKGADYFHKGGFQIEKDSVKPFSGSGYAGFLALNAFENTKNNNEFISVKLKESLNASQKYHIEFYIYFSNLRDKNEDLSINNISAMFTLDSVFNDNKLRKLFAKKPTLFNNDNVQINTPNRWIKISGEFIGRGGEKYMTIGNFINDKDYDYVRTNNSKKKIKTPGHIRLYFYIDNIKVIPIDDFGKEITWNKNENINPIPNFLFQIGKSLVIDNIYFKSNSASLKETSFNELDMLFDNIIKLEYLVTQIILVRKKITSNYQKLEQKLLQNI